MFILIMLSAILSSGHYNPMEDVPGYDVFYVAGQSNTYNGENNFGQTTPDATLDSTDADILQWGRFDGYDEEVILAEEPLDAVGYAGDRPPAFAVGFALGFAKMYKANGHLLSNRQILIVHGGEGATGFQDNHWNKGDSRYDTEMSRLQNALATGSGVNRLKVILWHQGEDETDNSTEATAHAAALLNMIDDMRTDTGYPNVPFVAGGLVPSLLAVNYYQQVNDNIEAIVTARDYTGYADPASPTELTMSTPPISGNHFSADAMRGSGPQNYNDYTTMGFAGRYWVAYLSALTNH